ncbi:hypothetical protein BVC80_1837g314 [Macleaya cordata]|uniref:Uncharacterized protein n=1 Tax=Macleaya cordata TaxID=56857 RepID=A0A200R476_MACCD|nr:hypothetical protein BVC80_1837g314 [Macleaya cordata]
MELEEDNRELQLLPSTPHTHTPFSSSSSASRLFSAWRSSSDTSRTTLLKSLDHFNASSSSSIDLQLSISLQPLRPPPSDRVLLGPIRHNNDTKSADQLSCNINIDALRWQAAEQIRLAALENAYAERVRELTRREMELAQSEFSRARHMWERAREDVEKAERLKEKATRRIDSTCMEITCQSCRQRFLRP